MWKDPFATLESHTFKIYNTNEDYFLFFYCQKILINHGVKLHMSSTSLPTTPTLWWSWVTWPISRSATSCIFIITLRRLKIRRTLHFLLLLVLFAILLDMISFPIVLTLHFGLLLRRFGLHVLFVFFLHSAFNNESLLIHIRIFPPHLLWHMYNNHFFHFNWVVIHLMTISRWSYESSNENNNNMEDSSSLIDTSVDVNCAITILDTFKWSSIVLPSSIFNEYNFFLRKSLFIKDFPW